MSSSNWSKNGKNDCHPVSFWVIFCVIFVSFWVILVSSSNWSKRSKMDKNELAQLHHRNSTVYFKQKFKNWIKSPILDLNKKEIDEKKLCSDEWNVKRGKSRGRNEFKIFEWKHSCNLLCNKRSEVNTWKPPEGINRMARDPIEINTARIHLSYLIHDSSFILNWIVEF